MTNGLILCLGACLCYKGILLFSSIDLLKRCIGLRLIFWGFLYIAIGLRVNNDPT